MLININIIGVNWSYDAWETCIILNGNRFGGNV